MEDTIVRKTDGRVKLAYYCKHIGNAMLAESIVVEH